jgi:mannose-6-phosphate isomerase-like protein (cupin superfamily)
MARTGDIIENPMIGDRIVFLRTAKETQGELLQFDDFLKVGGRGPIEHIHIRQEERLEVITGAACVRVNGQERGLNPGDFVVIAPGTPHCWWNCGDVGLQLRTEFRPAYDLERFFELIFGLARDGKTDETGSPSFLQIAVMSPAYDIYLPRPPIFVQKLLFAVLGPIAKMRGYRAWYPQYSRGA